jgi:hypothetical protein
MLAPTKPLERALPAFIDEDEEEGILIGSEGFKP